MVLQTVCFSLLLCSTLLLRGTRAAKPEEGGLDFSQAIQAVNSEKGQSDNINYDTFCKMKFEVHDQLLGCQLPAPNDGFGLRVCKFETGCEELMNSSISFHDSIRAAQLNLKKYSKEDIDGLKCNEENPAKTTCIGHLEEWIEPPRAKLVQFNENVFNKTEDDMISDINNHQTTPEAKAKTVSDLQKIIAWMTPPDDQSTLYKQLCDLQGLFLKDGGFVILTPSVKYKMMLSDSCYSGDNDPTNERVLAVLRKFIKELTPAAPGA